MEYRFDRLHQNTLVYVSGLRVLEVLLNSVNVLARAAFVEESYHDSTHLLVVGSITKKTNFQLFKVIAFQWVSTLMILSFAIPWALRDRFTRSQLLLNLPAKFRCTLLSIQLALLRKSSNDPLLKDLEQQGVFVEALNAHLRGTVYSVFAGNLGCHSLAGFQGSFQADNLCRFCQVSKDNIQT